MTRIDTVIVGHTARQIMADQLAIDVKADHLFIDNGHLGCEGNHRRAWEWHTARHGGTSWADWAVVLEDDAMPIEHFTDQLHAALAVAPTPIVSLYLGTAYPPVGQDRITSVLAYTDAHWLVGLTLRHAVGVAIRTDLLPTMRIPVGLPIDNAISNWAKHNGHLVAYTMPSLVDHADTEPVIPLNSHNRRERTAPRRAHRVGGRNHWTSRLAGI